MTGTEALIRIDLQIFSECPVQQPMTGVVFVAPSELAVPLSLSTLLRPTVSILSEISMLFALLVTHQPPAVRGVTGYSNN